MEPPCGQRSRDDDSHRGLCTLKAGDSVQIIALRANGTPYRWWTAAVENATPGAVVAVRMAGHRVYEPNRIRDVSTIWRTFYWSDRPYNVAEIYSSDGDPVRLCADVASPARWSERQIEYFDYELDIVKEVGKPAEIRDRRMNLLRRQHTTCTPGASSLPAGPP